jgi:hypothetical protein
MSPEDDPVGGSGESVPFGVTDDPVRGAGSSEEEPSAGDDLGTTVDPAPPAAETVASPEPQAPANRESPNMLPTRERLRSVPERLLVRVIATCGIGGIGAIMVSSKSQGWIIGLVVSIVSVVLSAILWSSKQL